LTVVKGKGIMATDFDKLVKWAESQKWNVERDASNHYQFYNPNGDHVTDYPSTPSSQRRWQNLIAALKRAGLPWPPPSKKEQRAQRRRGQ
jgi:hypothetical protein